MSAQQHPWERQLLAWAAEGIGARTAGTSTDAGRAPPGSGLCPLREDRPRAGPDILQSIGPPAG